MEDAIKLERYRRLIDIARDLASTLDLDVLLDRIIHAAADITEAEAASILLYDEAARELYFQVATNLDQPLMRGLVVPLEGSVAGWIVTHHQAVRISDAQKDPRHFGLIEKTTHFTTKSLLGVPLCTKENVIGVLETLNKRSGEFTETDENLLTVLGAQAAVAIENTRLFQQSDLIAEFVHELRNPLNSISTGAYLLLKPDLPQEKREQTIKSIHSESLRLNKLALSFLDLARLESGRVAFTITEFDLRALLEECTQTMQAQAAEAHVNVSLEVPVDFPKIRADRDKLRQVVINLLSNAIKYNRPEGSAVIKAKHGKGEWMLAVEDTGVGIPDEALPCLFQKFFRVRSIEEKTTGTGLGLSICKQIVQGHGGRIEVESKINLGTKFTLYLPCIE